MANDGKRVFSALIAVNQALRTKGFPATSPWWEETLRDFLHADTRQLVVRAGRRSGKSTNAADLAVAVALFGEWSIPPGEVCTIAIISTNKDEASQRLTGIKARLDALGQAHHVIPNGIQLVGRPCAIKVFAATISGVSGFTSCLVICDEVAKWKDTDTGVNPASDVLASVRPTLATQSNGRILLLSSPLGRLDAHYDAFEEGNSDFQRVASGTTWECNPTLTETDCKKLEPSKTLFDREYRALPSDSITNALDLDQYDTCVIDSKELKKWNILAKPFMYLDSSSGKGDAWTWCQGGYCSRREPLYPELKTIYDASGINPIDQIIIPPPPSTRLLLWGFNQIKGKFSETTRFDEIVAQMAQHARASGIYHVYGDQFNAFSLTGAFSRYGLQFTSIPWSLPSKTDAMSTLRRWFRERGIAVESGNLAEALRKEIGSLEERILPGGGSSFGARRGSHDDIAALLIGAAMVENTDAARGSPHGILRTVNVLYDYDRSNRGNEGEFANGLELFGR